MGDDSFRKALERFRASLTSDEDDEFRFTKLEDVHVAIHAVQAEHGPRKSMPNLNRIKGFLEAMKQLEEVLKIFLNVSGMVAFIWGPIKLLLLVANTWTESLDTLLGAYEQIGDNIPLLLQYQTLFRGNSYMGKILELLYIDILTFHERALRFFKQRAWRKLFHSTWKTFQTRFKGTLENIRRHKSLLENQASLIQFEEFQHARTKAEDAVRDAEDDASTKRALAVRDWLSAATVFKDQEHATETRADYPNSGRWLLTRGPMKSFLDPQSCTMPLLWMTGKPGAGKTILSSFLVEVLQKRDIPVVFFYCKYKDAQRNTFVSLARGILVQSLQRNRALLPYLYDKTSSSAESYMTLRADAEELLETALQSLDKVYIIIDGLDECEKGEKIRILGWFRNFALKVYEDNPESIRLLIVSQDEGDLRKHLSRVPTLHLTDEDNAKDIESYAVSWCKRIQLKFDIKEEEKCAGIVADVTSRAKGMFLFAKLVMTNLHNQTSRANLERELEPEKFPSGLEQAYARIVERIYQHEDNPEREDAARVLGWLVCARRSLMWHEIQGAVSVNLGKGCLDFKAGQLRIDSKELCGSLIEAHSGGEIELVHATARFYLVDKSYIVPIDEELKLASLCLEYLNFQCFQTSISDQEIAEFIGKGSYAFMEYAIVHWIDHLLESVQGKDLKAGPFQRLSVLLESFLTEHSNGSEISSRDMQTVQKNLKCLAEWPAYNQLTNVVKMMSASNSVRKSKTFKDPLDLMTHLQRVRGLLEDLATRDTCDRSSKDLLNSFYGYNWYKCSRTNCSFFYQGFSSRKDRDRHITKHERPFLCTYTGCPAAVLGYTSLKELEKHISIYHASTRDEWSFPVALRPNRALPATTLYAAAKSGDLRATECLVDLSKDYALPRSSGNPLYQAIGNGHNHVIRLFFKGATIWKSDNLIHAVKKALAHQHDSTALLLLSFQPNVCIAVGDSLLLIAAKHGRDAIVGELIFKYNIFPDKGDRSGRTPLSYAAEQGHDSTIHLLIKANCSPHTLSRDGKLPIYYAARNGRESTVRLLLASHDGEDFSKWLGVARLYRAARNKNYALVEQLLEIDGLDPNICCSRGSGDTPLLAAIRTQDDHMVRILLRSWKLCVNRAGRSGYTPLMLAAKKGYESIVKLLLKEQSLNVTFRDNGSRYSRAFRRKQHFYFQHESIARILRNFLGYFDGDHESIAIDESDIIHAGRMRALEWFTRLRPPPRCLNMSTSHILVRRFLSLPPEPLELLQETWWQWSLQLQSATQDDSIVDRFPSEWLGFREYSLPDEVGPVIDETLELPDAQEDYLSPNAYTEQLSAAPALSYEELLSRYQFASDAMITENPWVEEGNSRITELQGSEVFEQWNGVITSNQWQDITGSDIEKLSN